MSGTRSQAFEGADVVFAQVSAPGSRSGKCVHLPRERSRRQLGARALGGVSAVAKLSGRGAKARLVWLSLGSSFSLDQPTRIKLELVLERV